MTRLPHPLLVIAALLLGPVLASCANETPRAEPTPTVTPLPRGSEYVAMGDSYTAAPGTGPVAADDGCRQSTRNYPHLVAEQLGLKLTDVSCSAATSEHISAQEILPTSRKPPQGDALSSTTDLVTLRIGGNDFGLFPSVVFGCTAAHWIQPSGAPCTAADRTSSSGPSEQKLDKLQTRLVHVIRYVAKRAPHARIIVVGYPQFFPEPGPCAQLPLAPGDYAWARRINEGLVQAQQAAASRSEVEYIDVFGPTEGHDMCGPDPWIAGGDPSRPNAVGFHPYPEEQQLTALLLLRHLRGDSER